MGPAFAGMRINGAANNRLVGTGKRGAFRVAPYLSVTETAGQFLWRVRARMLVALLLKGVLVGIIIAVPAGPVGVLCIRRTIFHGQLAGFLSGLGAATADAVFGIIAGFGLTVISDVLLDYQNWLRVGGAAFLLYVGVPAFTADPPA